MPRQRREYLQLLDASKSAVSLAVDSFNRVHNPYRNESTLILLTNAWELLAKAVLVQKHQSIAAKSRGQTISAEVAVSRLREKNYLSDHEAQTIQQIISLRHSACHHILPQIDEEILHHLLYYGCKFYRSTVETFFRSQSKDLPGNFLSLSFTDLTTYSDKVQKSVSRVKRNANDQKLVWLLERGIAFDGTAYLTERQVAAKYRNKRKVLPHLKLGNFVRDTNMVRIVPVEAPRNFTADITLRKGSPKDASLPIVIQKTDVDTDYPYLTSEIAAKIGKNQNWTARAVTKLGIKNDLKYHTPVRASSNSYIQKYNDAAVQILKKKLQDDPNFNPYKL